MIHFLESFLGTDISMSKTLILLLILISITVSLLVMAQKIREWKEKKEAAARGEAPAETEMETEEEEPLYQKEEVSGVVADLATFHNRTWIFETFIQIASNKQGKKEYWIVIFFLLFDAMRKDG